MRLVPSHILPAFHSIWQYLSARTVSHWRLTDGSTVPENTSVRGLKFVGRCGAQTYRAAFRLGWEAIIGFAVRNFYSNCGVSILQAGLQPSWAFLLPSSHSS